MDAHNKKLKEEAEFKEAEAKVRPQIGCIQVCYEAVLGTAGSVTRSCARYERPRIRVPLLGRLGMSLFITVCLSLTLLNPQRKAEDSAKLEKNKKKRLKKKARQQKRRKTGGSGSEAEREQGGSGADNEEGAGSGSESDAPVQADLD